jgi:hypothetical protein
MDFGVKDSITGENSLKVKNFVFGECVAVYKHTSILVKCAISVIRAIAVMHYKGLSHFL